MHKWSDGAQISLTQFASGHMVFSALTLARTLYQLGSQVRVGQFSSKHRKIKDQQEDLVKTTPVHIGAGTPDRLRKLVDDGTLSLNQLCLIGTRQSERGLWNQLN